MKNQLPPPEFFATESISQYHWRPLSQLSHWPHPSPSYTLQSLPGSGQLLSCLYHFQLPFICLRLFLCHFISKTYKRQRKLNCRDQSLLLLPGFPGQLWFVLGQYIYICAFSPSLNLWLLSALYIKPLHPSEEGGHISPQHDPKGICIDTLTPCGSVEYLTPEAEVPIWQEQRSSFPTQW